MGELAELGRIAKAQLPEMEEGYRRSRLAGINPRSEVRVREGSGGRRFAREAGGGFAGGVAGYGAALGLNAATKGRMLSNPVGRDLLGYTPVAGAVGGGSYGATRNIKSGDTVGYHKKSGKKAKSKVSLSPVTGLPFSGHLSY